MKGKKETEEKKECALFKAEPALKKMKSYAILAAVGWTILLSGLLAWDIVSVHRNTEELAINEARANFNKDQAFRYWGGSHGGVYVPVDENTPPSPYLKHIPERDIMTPSGKKLTLMNPAYMVRQMNELFTKEYGVIGHITSLKLHNPDNVPDDWERKALEAFERGEKEILEFSDIDGAPYIRLMQPMMTQKGCLKCHAYQGYKVGDVRGGVSVSLSISDLLVQRNEKIFNQGLSHCLIWLLGLIGIFIGYGKIRRYFLERTDAEKNQREAEERATALLNATLESLILIDLEGKVLAVNSTGASRFNTTQDNLVGKNIYSFMPPEVVESRRKLISEILRTHKSVTLEDHRENRDFYTNFVPVQNGGIHAIAVFAQDITERKLAETSLEKSKKSLATAQEITSLGSWEWDVVTNEIVWSDQTYRNFGLEPGEVLPTLDNFFKFVHTNDRDFVKKSKEQALHDNKPYNIKFRYIRKDGAERVMHSLGEVYADENGKPVRMVGAAQDITERNHAEKELLKSEERLNRGQEIGHVGTWEWDPNTGELIWSDETYRIYGFAPGEVVPSYELFLEMVHPDDRGSLNKAVERALNEKAKYDVDCQIIRKDGMKRIVNATGKVIFDEEGNPAHMLGTFQDITERKQLEKALYFIAQRGWEAGGDNFFDSLVLYLAKTLGTDYAFVGRHLNGGRVRTIALYAGGGLAENIEYDLEGTPCENVVGREPCSYPENVQNLFPDDEMLVTMGVESYVGVPLFGSHGAPVGIVAVLDGNPMTNCRFVETILQAVAVRAAGEIERETAEGVLRRSESMLKAAQQIAQLGHWELDMLTDDLVWSDEIYRIFGIDKEKFDVSYEAFIEAIHPADREFVSKAYAQSLERHEPYDINHRLLMKDGTVKYVNEKCRTEYDDKGKPLRSIGTVQDITAAKETEMELERAKEAAESASLAKTDFLSRMSHELRTPLNSILGFAQIIQSEGGELDGKQGLCLDEIISAGWHLTDLVNEVLDISRVESGNLSLKVEPVDICPVMEECINLMMPLAEERNIKISCNLKVCNKETVLGDKTRLKEVFLNLLSNAVKYNVESGTVTISCDKIDQNRLLISVLDSGRGVSEEDQKLLFIPFSRIKGEDPAIQGTGIGLAISKHLVELMDGEIGVETTPGKGSTFWVNLQITEDAPS